MTNVHGACFPQPFIDDLRLQANIVQVVQEYVPLKRAGATLQGALSVPLREDAVVPRQPARRGSSTASAAASAATCSSSSSCTRRSASRTRCGCSRRSSAWRCPSQPRATETTRGATPALREALLKVHEVAAAYFREQLAGPGRRARAPAARRARRQPQTTIEQLGLGFAPQSRDGLKSAAARRRGSRRACCCRAAWSSQRDNGEVVDRFRNRLMVPICRDTGSVIAFGGRAMDADQVPKYLNSPETPIYSKGRTLYGLNLTKAADPEARVTPSSSRAISTSRRCSRPRRRRSSPPAARR